MTTPSRTSTSVSAKSKFIPVIPKFHTLNFKAFIAIQRHGKKTASIIFICSQIQDLGLVSGQRKIPQN